jgi:FKBP-type peptidyl-prolyl cis-trans isomerase FkpA
MKRSPWIGMLIFLSVAPACQKPKRAADGAPAAQVSKSGLVTQDIQLGQGPLATKGKLVQVHYTGYLPDGTAFDTTRTRNPLQFQLGQGTVLKGWDQGIEGMKVGGKRKPTVPPALAFGDRAVGQIKPNSTLVFDVELVAVK